MRSNKNALSQWKTKIARTKLQISQLLIFQLFLNLHYYCKLISWSPSFSSTVVSWLHVALAFLCSPKYFFHHHLPLPHHHNIFMDAWTKVNESEKKATKKEVENLLQQSHFSEQQRERKNLWNGEMKERMESQQRRDCL